MQWPGLHKSEAGAFQLKEMASTSNTFSDIAALSAKEYYEQKSLAESKIENGLLKYGQKATIPENTSKTIHWNRWNKFALAEDVSETGEPTAITANAEVIDATLKEFSSYISVPVFGDAVRMKSLIKESYPKFIEQAARTANRRIMTALTAGDTTTGNDFDPFTKKYCGGVNAFADLTSSAQAINNKDLQRAASYIEQQNPPAAGKVTACIDFFQKEQLMVNDQEFRDLLAKSGDISAFKNNRIPFWAGCNIDYQCDPWRETIGGTEATYAEAGEVFTAFVFVPDAFGVVQLMGKGGLKPKFHVQNISVTGATMTIGYRLPFKSAVLKADWGICLRSVCTGKSAISSIS